MDSDEEEKEADKKGKQMCTNFACPLMSTNEPVKITEMTLKFNTTVQVKERGTSY